MKKYFYYSFILITLFFITTINTFALTGTCPAFSLGDDVQAEIAKESGRVTHNGKSYENEYEYSVAACNELDNCQWNETNYKCEYKQNNNPTPSESTTTKSGGSSQLPERGGNYDDRPREIGDICDSEGFLNVVKMFKQIINIARALVPLILIFVTTMDVYKLVIDPNNTKSVKPLIIKRVIAALLAIIVPTIINIVLNSMGDSNSISKCYNHAGSIINVRTMVIGRE